MLLSHPLPPSWSGDPVPCGLPETVIPATGPGLVSRLVAGVPSRLLFRPRSNSIPGAITLSSAGAFGSVAEAVGTGGTVPGMRLEKSEYPAYRLNASLGLGGTDCMLVGLNGMRGVGLVAWPLVAEDLLAWRIAVGKTDRGGVVEREGPAVDGPLSNSIESGSNPPGVAVVGWVLGEMGNTPLSWLALLLA